MPVGNSASESNLDFDADIANPYYRYDGIIHVRCQMNVEYTKSYSP